MWLLKIGDASDSITFIQLEYHVGTCPPYAILSHRWGPISDEVSFQDLQYDPVGARTKGGYRKVEQCCIKALERGLRYAWIDTCCIDKSSSAELSEAINSMYAWYRDAHVCFAYLEDVLVPRPDPTFTRQFSQSSWFTRGWTLQELLAPSWVIFFTGDWCHEPIGSKASLANLINAATSIPVFRLIDRNFLSQASVAEKMSWASKRVTTRVEDEAYSLMGLFGVHIPIIYGEGRHAFWRLQEEIMKTTTDHSIFAWSSLPISNLGDELPVLAESPAQFLGSSDVVPMDLREFETRHGRAEPAYTITNFGLRIDLPICSLPEGFPGIFVAFIACVFGRINTYHEVGLILRRRPDRPDGHFFRVAFDNRPLVRSFRNAEDASKMRIQRSLLWISAHVGDTPKVRRELSAGNLDSLELREIECTNETPSSTPFKHNIIELLPGEYVALVGIFRGRYGCHRDQMHMLCTAIGIHNGVIWSYFDEKEALGHEFGTADELHQMLDLFGHEKSWYDPEIRGKIQLGGEFKWNSGPCGCFNVHVSRPVRDHGASFQIDGHASVQWVELKISDRALSRHSFDAYWEWPRSDRALSGNSLDDNWEWPKLEM